MRLGFHYHVPAILKNDIIYMPGYLGRFVDSMAVHCDSMLCFLHTPLRDEEPQMDYPLCSQNVKLISLGPHSSLPRRVLSVRQLMKSLRSRCDQMDTLLIRGPTPLLPWIDRACGKLPTVLLLVGNQLAGVDDLPQPRWRKEAIRTFWKWNNWQQMSMAKHSLTFVNSHLLYQQLSGLVTKLVETRTTTLEESDFYIRLDTCLDRPVRLLYTGRMDRTKGLLDILEAVAILVKEGLDLVFDLVGPEERNDHVVSDIMTRATLLELGNRILFHGYQPIGPALSAFYDRADIFITASQSSEGFPRTIWEAMAHSLPVIATRVGSIPDFIGDAAVIIEPQSVTGIVDAVNILINNPMQRQHYIKMGQELAKENTLDRRSLEMISEIDKYLGTLWNNGK